SVARPAGNHTTHAAQLLQALENLHLEDWLADQVHVGPGIDGEIDREAVLLAPTTHRMDHFQGARLPIEEAGPARHHDAVHGQRVVLDDRSQPRQVAHGDGIAQFLYHAVEAVDAR